MRKVEFYKEKVRGTMFFGLTENIYSCLVNVLVHLGFKVSAKMQSSWYTSPYAFRLYVMKINHSNP
jgi:hypothetical protein